MSTTPGDLPYYQLRSLRKTDEEKTKDQQRINDLIRQDLFALRQLIVGGVGLPGLAPVGTVVLWAGPTIPSGWLACDGSVVDSNHYPALSRAIGTTWGAGGGGNQFNLPDLRGRVPVGTGQGTGLTNRVLGTNGGEENHTLTVAEMPSHNHNVSDPGHTHTVPGSATAGGGTAAVAESAGLPQVTTSSSVTGVTTVAYGGGGAHNNMEPFAVLTYIIKV